MATLKEVLTALERADAAGNTEDARELAILAQQIMDDPSPYTMMDWGETVEEEPGFFENVTTGFGAGAVGMGEMSALGAASLLEEEDEVKARDKIKSVAESLRPEGGDPDSITYKLASGLGSIAGLAAPALGVAAAAPASIATAAGLGTSALLASSAGAGEASERARAADATEEERSGATLRGAGIGLLDVAPLGRFAKALEIPGLTKLIDKAAPKTINNFVDRLQNMAVTGTTEGLQEATSELLQNLNERGYNPERELVDAGLLEEGLVGGGAGAILQGIIDTVTKGRKIGAPKPPQEEPTPEEPVQPTPTGEAAPAEEAALDEIEAAQTEPSPIDELVAEQEEAKKQQWFPDMEPEQRIERINEELSLIETSPDYTDFSDVEKKDVIASLKKAAKESRAEIKQRKKTAKEDAVKAKDSAFTDAEYDLFGFPTNIETRQEETADEVQAGLEEVTDTAQMQLDLKDRNVTTYEQAQDAAREREALRAAERGDEAAFEQPDLFALEAEQARRNLGEEPAKREIDQLPEMVTEPTRPQGEQLDIESQIAAVTEADRKAEEKQAIEIQDTDTRVADEQRKRTDAARYKILQETIEQTPTRNLQTLSKNFSKRLQDNNFTETQPSGLEQEVLKKAAVAQGANLSLTPPTPPEPLVPAQDTSAETSVMEALVPEKGAKKRPKPVAPVSEAPVQDQAVEETVAEVTPEVTAEKATPVTPAEKRAERKKATRAKMQEAKKNAESRKTKPKPSGASVPSDSASVGDGRGAKKPADAARKSDNGPVEKSKRGTGADTRRAGRKRTALEEKPILSREETIRKAVARSKTQRVEKFNEQARAAKAEEAKQKRAAKQITEWFKNVNVGVRAIADSVSNTFPKSVTTDPTTVDDKFAIFDMLKSPQEARDAKTKKAAYNYFSKFERSEDALYMAVFDVVNETPQYRAAKGADPLEANFYKGLNAKEARLMLEWVAENMSKATNNWVARTKESVDKRLLMLESTDYLAKIEERARIAREKDEVVVEIKRGSKEAQQVMDELFEELTGAKPDELFLDPEAVAGLNTLLHPSVETKLKNNDLKGALDQLGATNPDTRIEKVAAKLAAVAGSTKIEIVEGLEGSNGKPVAGLFDPQTNTIKLDADTGTNAHTLLHEMTHAGVSETLAIKSHPVTKQLTKLFEQVKPMLGSAYGTTDVQEFVAEAFSNPAFQSELAGIYPDGSSNNAMHRFFRSVANFVRNMLGMNTKSVDSALDQVDKMVQGMLAPAPKHRFATEMPLNGGVQAARDLAAKLGDVQKNISDKGFANRAVEFLALDKIAPAAKKLLLQLSPSQALGDIARSVGLGKIGLRLHALMEEQRGAMATSDSFVHGKVREAEHWFDKAGVEASEAFNRVIYDPEYGATLYQVDPNLTESKARAKYKTKDGRDVLDDNGNNLWEIWQKQRDDWKKIGPEGQKIFNDMRSTYDTLYKKLVDVIYGRIDAAMKDSPDAAKKLKKEVYARMIEKGKLGVYFPLIRQGDYRLNVEFADKTKTEFKDTYAVLMFETKAERAAAMKTLEQDNNVLNMESVDKEDVKIKDFSKAPPSSFVARVIDQLKVAGVETDVQEQIMRMFIETLPETAVAKSLQRRKNVAGFVPDALLAMKTKAYDLGRQTARMEYGAKIQMLENELDEVVPSEVAEGKNIVSKALKVGAPQITAVKEELRERAQFARSGAKNKKFEKYVKTGNQVAFIYTIGFNVSSALVNLSQIPLFVFPMLGGKYGHGKTFTALNEAKRVVFGAGSVAKTEKKGAKLAAKFTPAYGIDEYFDVDLDGNLTLRDDLPDNIDRKELESIAPLVKLSLQRGQLNRSFMLDALGLEEGGRAMRGNAWGRALDTVSGVSAAMFNQAERLNRQVTLVAAYKLAYGKLKAEHKDWTNTKVEEEAAKLALYETQQTNGGAVLETAPRLAQQGIGRTALMYKTYGLQMYSTMMKSSFQLIDNMFAPKKGETPAEKSKRLELRRAARAQLIGVFGSSLALSGIYGVPLYGAVQLIADTFFLEDDEDDFNTMVRKYVGEGWYKGAINELTGVDVASRVGLSHLLIQENRFNPRASLEDNIMFYIGGPALSTVKRMDRAANDFSEGNFMRGVESALPAGISNGLKVMGGTLSQDGGFFTRRGDPIYTDMSSWEMMAKGMGFSPTGYVMNQEVNQRDKRVERAIVEQRSSLMKKVYVAMRTGDFNGYDEAMDAIMEFNDKYPTAAISGKNLKKSLKQHEKTSAQMFNGVTINPVVRSLIDDSRLEYSRSLYDL